MKNGPKQARTEESMQKKARTVFRKASLAILNCYTDL